MAGAERARCSSEDAHSVCLSVQELLCYLIDDGGFLIMSNQKEDWNRVSFLHRSISPFYHSTEDTSVSDDITSFITALLTSKTTTQQLIGKNKSRSISWVCRKSHTLPE